MSVNDKAQAVSQPISRDEDAAQDSSFDFEKNLQGMLGLQRDSGIPTRELGVMFSGLRVTVPSSTSLYQPTMGSILNPAKLLDIFRQFRRPALRDILNGFEGVVQPGEMLLVLGNPGSGCTTFLKTLGNQRKEYNSVDGQVWYHSFTPEEIAASFRGDVVYCPEDDIHFPTLTLDETVSFAVKMRQPRHQAGQESQKAYVSDVTNLLETSFGLTHAKHTPVGDASIRGLSGGEKKRVSICEALACRARIGLWDNPTRGLDASTALEFIKTLRSATNLARISTVMCLYQAGDSLYEQFDKVCVIYEGRMAYFGRADRARQYFIDMGFQAGARQTTSDFLAAVTSPSSRTPLPGYEHRVPRTADEFAERFLSSSAAIENRVEIESYRAKYVDAKEKGEALMYIKSVEAEKAKSAFGFGGKKNTGAYTVSLWDQAKDVAVRRMQIVKGNKAQEIAQICTFIIQGLVVGSIFYKLSHSTAEYYSRGGIIFFSLLFASITAMAEIPALFGQRPIVLRHYQNAMYHPFTEALGLTLVDIPISIVTLAVFSVILYFLVGFQLHVANFFIFYLFIVLMTITMKAYFRGITAAFASPAPAQAIGGMLFIIGSFYTGYTITKPTMIGALRWITYINPMKYGFEALMANEFHNLDGACSSLVPSGPGYENISVTNQVCTVVGSLPGQSTVNGDRYVQLSFQFFHKYLWRDLGITIAFFVLFIIVLLGFTEINTYLSVPRSPVLFLNTERVEVIDDEEKVLPSTEPSKLGEHRTKSEDVVDEKVHHHHHHPPIPQMHETFTWRHMQYEVPLKDKSIRKLLDDVSGYVAPGKLTALMGESGAGKTTLLNVLAERVSSGVVTGNRSVSGAPLPTNFQAQTGYVQQTDTHFASATVRETLRFSAYLRQASSVPQSEKDAYVETVLEMVGLEQYGDAIVGTLGPEARKRTTIGIELAAKPRLLLFLDEPTSGLDAQSAWGIMTCLRNLAHQGLAILCTIHQPSSELFEMFDRLLLLQKGGQTVFFGDVGDGATKMLQYFERHSGVPCPSNANPAEYFLDIIGAGSMPSSGADTRTDLDWHKIWVASPEASQLETELDTIQQGGAERDIGTPKDTSTYATSWLYQVRLLLVREFQRHWRDPVYLMAKLFLNVGGGLFIGLTFLKSKSTLQGTQNMLFAVYITLGQGLSLSNQIQVPYISTLKVFDDRERSSRMYSWAAMVTALFLGEIPFDLIMGTLYYIVWYWTVDFPTSRAAFTFLIIGIVWPLNYVTLSQATAALAGTAQGAGITFAFLSAFSMIFNGTLQPYSKLGWWKWMNRVSPYTYFIESTLGQAAEHRQLTCMDVEYVTVTPPAGQTCGQYLSAFTNNVGGYVSNLDATDACQYCPARTTDQFLEKQFNVFFNHHWRDFGILMGYVAFNIAFTYFITWVRQPRRKVSQ